MAANRNHWELEPRVSNTPEELWKNAIEYFKWCDANPILERKTIMAGKEAGRKVEVESIRPYLIKALCLQCGVSEEYLRDMRKAPEDSSAYKIVSRIIMNVWVQIAELGSVSAINSIFAAKMLNLDNGDEAPQKVLIEYVGDVPKLATSENDILKMIELKNGELKIPKVNVGEIKDISPELPDQTE